MYNSNQSTTEILASEDFIDAIYFRLFLLKIFELFSTRIPSYRWKSNSVSINAIKLYDALCISFRNIPGKFVSKPF